MATILPLMSSGLRMLRSAKPITLIGLFCSSNHGDRRALYGRAQYSGDIHITEGGRFRSDRLGGYAGTTSFLISRSMPSAEYNPFCKP